MNNPKVSRDEQIRLIHECRTSGMSDNQWCLQHGIRPGTFYNWVSRNRKRGDVHIPSPGGAAEYWPEEKPDIVQINLVREGTGAIAAQEGSDCQIAVPAALHSVPVAESGSLLSLAASVMELEMNGARLRISNGIDPALLTQVLQVLRSSAC